MVVLTTRPPLAVQHVVLTCDPCFNLLGNGVAFCEFNETLTYDSECVVKGINRKMFTTTTVWFYSVDIRF